MATIICALLHLRGFLHETFTPMQRVVFSFIALLACGSLQAANRTVLSRVVLEDFRDVITTNDFGFDDFGGNSGEINKAGISYGVRTLLKTEGGSAKALRFDWNFEVPGKPSDSEAFTGLFFSVFGLTDTRATFDGQTMQTISFPEHNLDFNRLDGAFLEPGDRRKLNQLCIRLAYTTGLPMTLRIELGDASGGGRFTRFRIAASPNPCVFIWDFRTRFRPFETGDIDLRRVKKVTLVIERKNSSANVTNPTAGSFDLRSVWFVPSRPAREPLQNIALLDLSERRALQYFVDWSSRKAESKNFPQDRSTFNDLLTVGGVGFALPSYAIMAERGFLKRTDAATRVAEVLRSLADPAGFGPEAKGRRGYRGWFYHFLGVDGFRKLNFDEPTTQGRDESLNTVELSAIDTGLALMGVLVAQSYFDQDTPLENEIRTLAQQIYDRVDWAFMLDVGTNQFFRAWKPNEMRDADPPYAIADADGFGSYTGVPGSPGTLDYQTDEDLILQILAAGSQTYPVSTTVFCAVNRMRDAGGLVRTYPGTLFTYQFLHAFLDTRTLVLPACGGEGPINFFENSREAMLRTIAYAEENPDHLATFERNSWGLSACEIPDDRYRAPGAPMVAVDGNPFRDGTVTYYAMLSAVSFGNDLKVRATAALRRAWKRGHWHYRFGLPDAFHDDIGRTTLQPEGGNAALRSSGPWAQRALFAIDQGPMAMHLENARSGLIWRLMAGNPNIERAIARLNAPPDIQLEGETGSGEGVVQQRGAAANGKTIWLHAGETCTLNVSLAGPERYALSVRYSNDNFGASEVVTLKIDGQDAGQFTAEDTGDFGFGWNNFVTAPLPSIDLAAGGHTITITPTGGDGFGVEIDYVKLDRQAP